MYDIWLSLTDALRKLNSLFDSAAGLPPTHRFGRHYYTGTQENWDRYIGASFDEVLAILSRDLPPRTKIGIHLDDLGQGKVSVKAYQMFHYWRRFDLAAGELDTDSQTLVDGNDRAQNFGRVLMRNEIEFFHQCGVTTIPIHCGWESGGYVWARFGYLPSDIDDCAFEDRVRTEVGERFAAIANFIPKNERERISQFIDINEPKDVWKIADCRTDLTPRLKDYFNKAAKDGGQVAQDIEDAFECIDLGHYPLNQLDMIKQRIKNGQKVTLGRYLLAGTDWLGHIDTTDEEQMHRVGTYVGGWTNPALANASRMRAKKPKADLS